jgi:hypothetical protein
MIRISATVFVGSIKDIEQAYMHGSGVFVINTKGCTIHVPKQEVEEAIATLSKMSQKPLKTPSFILALSIGWENVIGTACGWWNLVNEPDNFCCGVFFDDLGRSSEKLSDWKSL